MDPQATLQAIFDAIESGDADSFRESFSALANWLLAGGFPPNLSTMGTARQKTIDGYRTVPRRYLSCGPFHRPYVIQTIDADSDGGPYEFVVYESLALNAGIRQVFALPM